MATAYDADGRIVSYGGQVAEVTFEIGRGFVAESLKERKGRDATPAEIDAVFEDLNREIPQLVQNLIRTRAAYGVGGDEE